MTDAERTAALLTLAGTPMRAYQCCGDGQTCTHVARRLSRAGGNRNGRWLCICCWALATRRDPDPHQFDCDGSALS